MLKLNASRTAAEGQGPLPLVRQSSAGCKDIYGLLTSPHALVDPDSIADTVQIVRASLHAGMSGSWGPLQACEQHPCREGW